MTTLFQRIWRRMRYGVPVIVVSGLPRSGTSLLMQMLEAGGAPIVTDQLREADADNPKGYYELERVKDLDKGGDKSWVNDCRGKALKVISYLLRDLPPGIHYKVIFVDRDLAEVLASQNKMLVRRGESGGSASLEKMITNYRDHVLRVRAYLRYAPYIDYISIPYREILAQPHTAAKVINAFIGGHLDEQAMAAVVDPSLYRNRAEQLHR